MLPRWHIIYGALFTFIIWLIIPDIGLFYLSLIFLASFLIDFDHYLQAIRHTRHLSLFKAFDYYKVLQKRESENYRKGIRKKEEFYIFHTVEFHLLIALLSIWFSFLFYVFLGMLFHSLLDIIEMVKRDRFYTREYFFFNWLYIKYKRLTNRSYRMSGG